MPGGQDDDSDKSFEATPQKLEKARKKGEVPRSQDLSVAASYAGLLIAALMTGTFVMSHFGTAMVVVLEQSHELSELVFSGPAQAPLGGVFWITASSVASLFMVPLLFVCVSIIAQRAFVFAPSKLQPKLSRVSLISNAKNKFGRNGLFEFFKSFIKLVIYSVCLGVFISHNLDGIVASIHAAPAAAAGFMIRLSLEFLFIVLLVALCIGGVDGIWQYHEHLRKNRMSRKEVQDEVKDAEGDPHLKGERRQRAQAIAANQMMADVPTADVVVVNPTHYSVALKWSRLPGEAPVCVAKGVDLVALSIRKKAIEAGVPVHSDPPTARSLYAVTDIGQEISAEHYQPVATAIRFAEAMRQKARGAAV